MRYIRVFSDLSSQLRYASQKRVLLEVALIRLTHPAMERSGFCFTEIHRKRGTVRGYRGQRNQRRPGDLWSGGMAAFGTCGLPGQPSAGSDPAGSLQRSPLPVIRDRRLPEFQWVQRQKPFPFPKAQLEDLNLIRNEWAKIVRSIGGGARSYLRDTVVEPGGEGCLTIVFLDPMSYDMGKRPTVIGELSESRGCLRQIHLF